MNFDLLRYLPFSVLLAFAGCLYGCGETGLRGGDTMAHRPSVLLQKDWFKAKLEISSDVNASVDELRVDPMGGLVMKNAKFGNSVAAALAGETLKLGAMGQFVKDYAVLAQVRWDGLVRLVIGSLREVMPVFNLLAAARIQETTSGIQLTLPNGASIGGQRITKPGDVTGAINAAMQRLKEVEASVQMQAAAGKAEAATAPNTSEHWINPAFERWLQANDPELLGEMKVAADKMRGISMRPNELYSPENERHEAQKMARTR